MTPSKPYLIRAFFDWIVDNDLTPHLLIDAEFPGTLVPEQHVQNGQIILNISPGAVQNLQLDNELISFSARFSGTPFAISFSPDAVLGIYANENGQGMLFEPTAPGEPETAEEDESPKKPPGGPSLKVVK
ncbi:ClpXP protease specificity-enhancing factor [Solemya velum gill symbiont]|uniref:ClpXP protease specificity-enhancing factor n=1 Tax=Solemya velum gill symbiont TaxID=2340 RepID=A0A0B0H1E7_SOVGS|nr:ClpXP protease specificity-enhancing factor [Solemya velum gill symbiont]KHF24038.1 stringent starvation protein B [Solemya velum gill symbiont]OOY36195.1 ClpXP protease specificity-enhancing factor [Solemya velum gill symbiont]OOY39589.1 ClpXP protease specificity-enhancing factor [Solemya velum gill symbiont]OOY44550.1 ClpXP protease specificity-enhancing factor [Solemya velum gill symbiont]OOY46795.1 ClpXP protease specificity-enhancing factor [Solemya velum gill symbiont]